MSVRVLDHTELAFSPVVHSETLVSVLSSTISVPSTMITSLKTALSGNSLRPFRLWVWSSFQRFAHFHGLVARDAASEISFDATVIASFSLKGMRVDYDRGGGDV
jgi:hypothetical protein